MNTLERALLKLKTSFLSENQNEALASNRGGRKEGRGSVSVQQPPHSSRFGSSCTPIRVKPADVTAVILRTQLIFMISEKCLYPSRNKLLLAIVVSVVH